LDVEERHLTMNPMGMVSRFVSVAALGLTCAFVAVAGPINVVNFSFELPVPGGFPGGVCGTISGCWSVGPIPGWTRGGDSGLYQPGTPGNTVHFSTISDGPTVAYSNGGIISQIVSQTVVPGDVYTLMVDLGRRNDYPAFEGAADLLIGGAGGVRTPLASGIVPSVGHWSTFTATYVGLSTDIGKSITIELIALGVQGDFDNVRLSSSAPEPAGVTLFGLGLVALLAVARRKRAS
jgi:hypothetical protein